MTLADKRTALYRLYGSSDLFGNADTLLYVGVTTDPQDRWYRHKRKRWWPEVERKTIEWYPSRIEALTAEAEAIRDEKPFYNLIKPDPEDPLQWSLNDFSDQWVEGSCRARARKAKPELCPVCRSRLPPLKTCPGCGKKFYRSPGGQISQYCSERCRSRIAGRRARGREGLVTEGLSAEELPERIGRVVHALLETWEAADGGPLTSVEVFEYDTEAPSVISTGSALAHARRFGLTVAIIQPGHPALWSPTERAWELRRALESRFAA